jgi:hypothetical protein
MSTSLLRLVGAALCGAAGGVGALKYRGDTHRTPHKVDELFADEALRKSLVGDYCIGGSSVLRFFTNDAKIEPDDVDIYVKCDTATEFNAYVVQFAKTITGAESRHSTTNLASPRVDSRSEYINGRLLGVTDITVGSGCLKYQLIHVPSALVDTTQPFPQWVAEHAAPPASITMTLPPIANAIDAFTRRLPTGDARKREAMFYVPAHARETLFEKRVSLDRFKHHIHDHTQMKTRRAKYEARGFQFYP